MAIRAPDGANKSKNKIVLFQRANKLYKPKVTPFYDHTMEEVAAMLTSGKDAQYTTP